MNRTGQSYVRRLPRKVWIILICLLAVALMPLFGAWPELLGPRDPRAALLGAVAADLAKDPRVNVVREDRASGQLVVKVLPTNQTLTLVLTAVKPRPLPDGQAGEEWNLEWKGPDGNVVAMGHGIGVPGKTVHVEVPGLP